MADSIAPVVVPTTWLDVYDKTGITVGTAVKIQNVGNSAVRFAIKATEPTTELGGIIYPRQQYTVDGTPSGIWIQTQVESGLVTVQS